MATATMGEGNTPLIPSSQIGPILGFSNLFFKLENCNPSGSYKDRFIAAEVARILRCGKRACIATSSGNTGASLAAYCARYGLTCVIAVNEQTPAGKLAQMQAHGARVLRVKGFCTSPADTIDVFRRLKNFSENCGVPLVVSAFRYCPESMAAVESLARELVAQLGSEIQHIFVPVGGGGLFSAVCRGFENGSSATPRVHAIQTKGCSTVVAAFERGDNQIKEVESKTRISGLAIPFDIDASLALDHLRRSRGFGFAVDDEEIFEAQKMMLNREGIYTEPAGATALAGLIRAHHEGIVHRNDTIICLVTGHGFKDPESILRLAEARPATLISEDQLEDCLTGVLRECV